MSGGYQPSGKAAKPPAPTTDSGVAMTPADFVAERQAATYSQEQVADLITALQMCMAVFEQRDNDSPPTAAELYTKRALERVGVR